MRLTFMLSLLISVMVCGNAYAKKTVLVTGGLSGVGKEITLAFRDAGWEVWATSRDPEKYPAIANVNIRKLDVTDSNAIKALFKDIKHHHQHLDVLVNNAALTIIGPEETLSTKQAQTIMAVNVIGPLQMMQESLPMMRKNNGGKIINISSTSGIRALPGLGIYAASKMALEGLSAALAAEAAQWNIWVSVVEPGTVKGNWIQHAELTENLKEYPGYVTFTNQLKAKLKTKAQEQGQAPSEIAQLTLQIADSATPNFRYQTSDAAKTVANEVLLDPTGNFQRERATIFARELYDYHS